VGEETLDVMVGSQSVSEKRLREKRARESLQNLGGKRLRSVAKRTGVSSR